MPLSCFSMKHLLWEGESYWLYSPQNTQEAHFGPGYLGLSHRLLGLCVVCHCESPKWRNLLCLLCLDFHVGSERMPDCVSEWLCSAPGPYTPLSQKALVLVPNSSVPNSTFWIWPLSDILDFISQFIYYLLVLWFNHDPQSSLGAAQGPETYSWSNLYS